ncbi:MAG: cache domain-containing protein [Desulfamplus sp.]|nr:cache domain-containing protein [Desulfamplus sp.]
MGNLFKLCSIPSQVLAMRKKNKNLKIEFNPVKSIFGRFFIGVVSVSLLTSIIGLCIITMIGQPVLQQLQQDTGVTILRSLIDMISLEKHALNDFKKQRIEDCNTTLLSIVESMATVLETYHQDVQLGRMTLTEAQSESANRFQKLVYGKGDYVFAINNQYELVVHPDPKMIGVNWYNLQDPEGVYIIRELVNAAKTDTEKVGGYVQYKWPRKGHVEPEPKSSIAYYFKPWDWILGTGVYMDNIELDVRKKQEVLLEKLRQSMASLVFGKNGYAFVFDENLNVIIHPLLENKNLKNLKNPKTGNPIGFELIEAAGKPWGENIHQYFWDRPDDPEHYVHEKYAWCAREPVSGWYVATSAYMDDIEAPIEEMQRGILLVGLGFIALLIIALFFMVQNLLRPINRLQEVALGVSAGDLSLRISETFPGEIGDLCMAFNEMIKNLEASLKAEAHQRQVIEKAEQKYRSIFENAVEGIFQSLPEGQFISANPAMARIFGYDSPEDLIQNVTSIRDQIYVDPTERDKLLKYLNRTRQVHRNETIMKRKDGSYLWASVITNPIYDESNNLLYYEGIIEDITERRKVEEKLKKAHNNLEQRVAERTQELEKANLHLMELDRLKSGFLSSVSHELRTPLTSILGFAKLISKDMKVIGKHVDSTDNKLTRKIDRSSGNLGIIVAEGERLTRLINDVLDLSKIESGQVQWNDTTFNIKTLLENATKAVQGQFMELPNVAFRVDLQPDLPDIHADSDRIMQVMINLQNNAAKFTSKGEVRVTASSNTKRDVLIEVSDTGIGIAEQNLDKVFDKFHQVTNNDTLKDKPKGTGLGLAICQKIISHYGGRIWVTSEVGKGSTFSIVLPGIEADGSSDQMILDDKKA